MSKQEVEQAVNRLLEDTLLEDIQQADVLRMNAGERDLLAWDLDQLGVRYEINENFVRVWLPEYPLTKRHEILTLFRQYRLMLQPEESIQE